MEDIIIPPEIEAPTPRNNRLIALILFAFLTTFAGARIFVYAILEGIIPNLFLYFRGVHVHHFTYGVVILVIIGLYLLLKRPEANTLSFRVLTYFYGVGLGLTFDEFGMWIRLEDNYWIRQSYDAVIIVTLLLLNLIYWRHLIRAISEILKVLTYPVRHIGRKKIHP